ncbi:disease resistance protein RGA2-like [Henckelia pumila]|uniref:disease resistance protein RGA2-like n=1 Tax=Henckelia pumila TaxID=405737 RepID=UPI003C6E2C98
MAEVVMIDSAVQFLLGKLISVAGEEIGVVRGFENELKTLQQSWRMVQGFLEDASKRCIQEDQAVKAWLQNLESVTFEIFHVLDEVNYEILRRKVSKMKRKVCCSYSFSVAFRSKMGHGIKDVNDKLKSINDEASSYGLQQRVANLAISLPLVVETNSFAADPIFIGRGDAVSAIVDDMIKSSHELEISVVPIVGMGGLGKTTLTRNVFNHQSIAKHFNERIWVSVSKEIDNKDLLLKILESLSKTFVQASLGEETLLEQIRSKLEDARYLLVLDDYVNDKRHDLWETFMNCMKGISPKKGNFIIVTTRNQDVASDVKTRTVPSIDFLSVDDCWSIIKARTFLSQPVPEDFEAIGKEIARACQGLPLAANVVGGSLRGKGIDDWKSFQHESGFSNSSATDDSLLKVLKISYDRLPSSLLKKCFAYCSIFSKGEKLKRERLIQLWMAEGLLVGNNDESGDPMEILGDKFYNILLQNFFLHEPIIDKYGRIKYSKMHDFVHDLSSSVEKAKSPHAEEVTLRVRYLPVDYEHNNFKKEQTSCLRNLFLNKFEGVEFIGNIMLTDCKYLCVLDLHGTSMDELTISIVKLIHLRFLDLSYTDIRNLPGSICKLFNLQTLRLLGCTELRELPDELKFLVGLRHFAFSPFIESLSWMPPEMRNLTSLRTLNFFIVSDKERCRIDELGFLKNLEGKLRIWNLEKVGGKEESERALLSEKKNLEVLKFVWSESSRNESNNDCEVLEGLQPHPNLKGLTIQNFRGDHFPSWTMKMAVEQGNTLDKLIKIVLIYCEGCKEIPTLGHLPLLKILRVNGLRNVRSIGPSFYWEEESSRNGVPFRSLEYLTLENMESLSDWVEAPNTGSTAFRRLEYLKIEDCPSMMTSPSHDFLSLKRLNIVRSNFPLANICKKVSSLTELEMASNLDVTFELLEMLLQNNQHLQELKISYCDNLTQLRLPDTLKSLLWLEIWWCPNLASIQILKGLSALQHMDIRFCHELRELQGEMQESSTSLEFLNILDCGKLRSIPKGMDCLNKLSQLSIGPFSEETGSTLLNETLKGPHQFLRTLYLFGNRNWESLPDQLQHLTALIRLEVCEFGIEALPEWFSNLSSLEVLIVSDCEKLRDVSCLRHLTSLKELFIEEECSRMPYEKFNESNPEISHIPLVYVDGRRIG